MVPQLQKSSSERVWRTGRDQFQLYDSSPNESARQKQALRVEEHCSSNVNNLTLTGAEGKILGHMPRVNTQRAECPLRARNLSESSPVAGFKRATLPASVTRSSSCSRRPSQPPSTERNSRLTTAPPCRWLGACAASSGLIVQERQRRLFQGHVESEQFARRRSSILSISTEWAIRSRPARVGGWPCKGSGSKDPSALTVKLASSRLDSKYCIEGLAVIQALLTSARVLGWWRRRGLRCVARWEQASTTVSSTRHAMA